MSDKAKVRVLRVCVYFLLLCAFVCVNLRLSQGLELWRPFTSLIYLGPLSMSWLTNVYFLTQHGTRLELVSGTAEQVIFLLVVVRDPMYWRKHVQLY